MHFVQAINSDISVLTVCNKTGGTIKGDIKKNVSASNIVYNYNSFGSIFVSIYMDIIHWRLLYARFKN